MSGHRRRLISSVILMAVLSLTACGAGANTLVPVDTATPVEAAVTDTPGAPAPTDAQISATGTAVEETPTDTVEATPTDSVEATPTDTVAPADTAEPTSSPAPAPTNTARPCPAPTIASFTVQPDAITAGDTAMLNWGKVGNANSAVIDNGIGGVGTPGSKAVRPGATTTYQLTARGCGGVRSAKVTVTVFPPLPTPNPGVPQGNQDYQQVLSFSWGQGGELLPNSMYGIEIQIKRKGQNSFKPFIEQRNLLDTSYDNTNKPFPNDTRQLRFRVWQINKDNPAQHSGPSDWSIITFTSS